MPTFVLYLQTNMFLDVANTCLVIYLNIIVHEIIYAFPIRCLSKFRVIDFLFII